jgi:trimethylamine--corrinoid protein Co-methyltransferase
MTNSRSQRRRRERPQRVAGQLHQRPFRQVRYAVPPVELLSADHVEAIHGAALTILQEVGLKVLSADARAAYARAGFDVEPSGERVAFEAAGLEALVAQAPAAFDLHARNPARTLRLGDGMAAFASVGGPAYCMDRAGGRRDGTYAEMCDFLRVVQSLEILHQEGGGGFEALDLPAETRHLDLYYAQITLLDKNWQPWGIGRGQAMDAIEMAAIMLGTEPMGLAETPVFTCVVNTNSPLQIDIPMAEGLMVMAAHGQAVIVTPFTLSGAMSPVTIAGALAQQHAEAMAGIALAQIVRPGAPVVYGGFTSNVDMRTGAPAFGTPEYVQAAQASGQLARRLGLPFRSSNVTAANTTDAQAAYESMMALWGAMTGQANLVMHAAGWLGGGLTASCEKLIIDAELLQMMAACHEPFPVDAASLALDAVREVGPAGHFFGATHTMERYETAFYAPLLSNWDNFDTWVERGRVTAEQRAAQIYAQLLKDYEQPPLDSAIDGALKGYVARRKREIGGR